MADKRKIGGLLTEKELRRRYPDSGKASVICLRGEKTLKLPSENLALNYHLGGGISFGKIIEIFGEESTGKSALAKNFIKVAQALGGVGLWDDAESTFDADWAEQHGIDLTNLELLPFENAMSIVSDWLSDMIIYYRSKLLKNEPIVVVIDSIAVLETLDAMGIAEMDTKAEMGKRSFEMGKMLRKRTKTFAKYGACVILINQIRKKVGASKYEDPDTTPMAQCIKYYASQRIGLYRGKRIKQGGKDKGKWVGNVVHVRTKKNKTSIPRDNIQAEFYFKEDDGKFGYHKYHGFEELLIEKGIVKRKHGGKYYYKGELVAKNDNAFRDLIANNGELRAKFIKKLGINTVSKTRKQLENIEKNLYPVKQPKDKKGETE